MKWAGITPDQYEQVRKIVKWETDIPKGGVFHVATFDKEGLRVTDIWESAEDVQNFVNNRILPAVAKIGITTQPVVDITPVHATFIPALQKLG